MSLQISLILWWFMFGNTHCFCTAEDKKVYQKVKSLSRVWLFVTPWTVAYQDPPSMEFSRQEYWSGLPFPSPGYLPNPGIEPESPSLQADAERLLLNHAKMPGFLASGGKEFNLGPEMRLDSSELLCNKVLLKYKRDRESFWHRHQKRAVLAVLAAVSSC